MGVRFLSTIWRSCVSHKAVISSFPLIALNGCVILSSGVIGFSLVLLLHAHQRSPFMIALALFCQAAPRIYLGWWAGNLIERWGKMRTMKMVLMIWIILYSTMAWTCFGTSGEKILVSILIFQVLLSSMSAFYETAFFASVSFFVPPHAYGYVYGVMEFFANGAVLLIPVLGSFLWACCPLWGVLAGAAFLSFLLWVFLMQFSVCDLTIQKTKKPFWDVYAFQFIWSNALLKRLLVYFWAGNILNGITSGFVLVYVLECCKGNAHVLGSYSLCLACATLCGSGLSAWLPEKALPYVIGWCSLGAALLGRVCFGRTTDLVWLTVLSALRMSLIPITNTANQILWSRETPLESRPSVFGVRRLIAQGGYPLAVLVGGMFFKGCHAFFHQNLGHFIQMIGGAEIVLSLYFLWAIRKWAMDFKAEHPQTLYQNEASKA